MAVEIFHDQVSTKECVGRGLHAKRTRFRSIYRARLVVSKHIYATMWTTKAQIQRPIHAVLSVPHSLTQWLLFL